MRMKVSGAAVAVGLALTATAQAWAAQPVSPPPASAPAVQPAAPVQSPPAAPPQVQSPSTQPIRRDQVPLLIRMLEEAPSHGFGGAEFPVAQVAADARAGDPAAVERLRALSLAYARAQHGLRISAARFDPMWGLKPQFYDAGADLDQALRSDKLAAWIAAQPPPFARYRTLRDGLAVYRKLAAEGGWKPVPEGPEIVIGEVSPRVRALRARLAFEDGMLAGTPLSAPFDEPLKASLARFQARHGLLADGVTGARTVAALNVTPAARATQVRLNMERWRWLPRQWPVDRIEVNIAAAALEVYQNGQLTDRMLAAAGRPADQTPMLQSTIHSIVLNPPWRVPNSIAEKELLPKGAAYLARNGFTVLPPGQGVRLIQKAGPGAALGQVKFDFANDYGVYLHDTPSRAAFDRASRAVSHGCVRVQRPFALAKRLLASAPEWPPEKVDEVLDSTETTRAHLATPMSVLLMYWTAFPEGSQLAFRDDVYGWDAKLLGLLAADRPA